MNSPQDGNVRHFSVNDANENKNVLKNKLWKQFAHQKRNLKADKNLSLLKIEEPHEDNRMESDEDDENLWSYTLRITEIPLLTTMNV